MSVGMVAVLLSTVRARELPQTLSIEVFAQAADFFFLYWGGVRYPFRSLLFRELSLCIVVSVVTSGGFINAFNGSWSNTVTISGIVLVSL